jgi:superfamily I DNA/RNA helicase
MDVLRDSLRDNRIFRKRLFSRITYEALPVVRKLYDQEAEAEFIVDKILEYREQGVALNQIAILVRAFWHARYVEVIPAGSLSRSAGINSFISKNISSA